MPGSVYHTAAKVREWICQAKTFVGKEEEVGAEGDEAESGVAQSSARAEREAKVQQNVSSMMFVEMLFWKNQKECEDVQEEYNWRVSLIHICIVAILASGSSLKDYCTSANFRLSARQAQE